MDQRRHDGIRVQLHVFLVELVAAQRHQVVAVLEPLLRERDAHLLSADRIDAVIELKH
jgi:hypothetical protein